MAILRFRGDCAIFSISVLPRIKSSTGSRLGKSPWLLNADRESGSTAATIRGARAAEDFSAWLGAPPTSPQLGLSSRGGNMGMNGENERGMEY